MINIVGEIHKIEEIKNNFNNKFLVTINQTDKEQCFIEFRGNVMMNVLKPYKVGEVVHISAIIEGKISKFSASRYNNIVARNIKTVTPIIED